MDGQSVGRSVFTPKFIAVTFPHPQTMGARLVRPIASFFLIISICWHWGEMLLIVNHLCDPCADIIIFRQRLDGMKEGRRTIAGVFGQRVDKWTQSWVNGMEYSCIWLGPKVVCEEKRWWNIAADSSPPLRQWLALQSRPHTFFFYFLLLIKYVPPNTILAAVPPFFLSFHPFIHSFNQISQPVG